MTVALTLSMLASTQGMCMQLGTSIGCLVGCVKPGMIAGKHGCLTSTAHGRCVSGLGGGCLGGCAGNVPDYLRGNLGGKPASAREAANEPIALSPEGKDF